MNPPRLKLFGLLFVFLLTLIYPQGVLAASKTFLSEAGLKKLGFTEYEAINPNLLAFPLKRIGESVILKITPGERQKEYKWSLYEKRFKELVYIINYDKTGFIVESVDRYNSFSGTAKELGYGKDPKTKKQALQQIKLLEILRDRYPSGSAYWVKIQEACDSAKGLI